jgi:hypothetical protein
VGVIRHNRAGLEGELTSVDAQQLEQGVDRLLAAAGLEARQLSSVEPEPAFGLRAVDAQPTALGCIRQQMQHLWQSNCL